MNAVNKVEKVRLEAYEKVGFRRVRAFYEEGLGDMWLMTLDKILWDKGPVPLVPGTSTG